MNQNPGDNACSSCTARALSIFARLNNADLDQMTGCKSSRLFRKGETIYSEGNAPLNVYCLQQGKVKIMRTGENGREGVIRFVGPGAVFGHRPLFSGDRHYDNDAVSLEDSFICAIPHSFFIDLVSQRPELAGKVLELLSDELKSAEDRMIDSAQKQVHERVAGTLLLLVQSFGYAEDNLTLNLSITREELAGMVGTVPETTIRALSVLRRKGYIKLGRRHISILDHQGLEREASLTW